MAIQPQYFSSMRIANLSDFSLELAASNNGGRKQLFYTSTWSNDLATLTAIVDLQDQFVNTVAGVTGLAWSLSLQPLVTAITSKSASTGGNPLGVDASDGNLVRKCPSIHQSHSYSVSTKSNSKHTNTNTSRTHYSKLGKQLGRCRCYRCGFRFLRCRGYACRLQRKTKRL